MESSKIEGKVARLVSGDELVINRGSEQGVQPGMYFGILVPGGAEIEDPDTGEPLGSIDLFKTYVKAIEVHELFTVARTFRTRMSHGGALWMGGISSMTQKPREIRETLKSGEGAAYEEISEEDSYVKRGDSVVQVKSSEIPDF